MARKPRLYAPGSVYHVMLRGNGGQPIFFQDGDYHHLYDLIADGVDRFGHRVHAFCCMPNHLHLALQVGEGPLSKILQNLAFRYTPWIHRRQRRIGHLFQGRYKALTIDAESYLLQLVRYIHLNPVRAGLVKDPIAYRWSGHRAYLGKEKLTWLTTDWVMGQFDRQAAVARRRYYDFVRQGLGEGHRVEFHHGDADARILGDDQFVEKLLGRSANRLADLESLDGVIKRVCDGYGISEAELRRVGRSRRDSEARAMIGYLARQTGCATLTQVAHRFGRDVTTPSKSVRRVTEWDAAAANGLRVSSHAGATKNQLPISQA